MRTALVATLLVLIPALAPGQLDAAPPSTPPPSPPSPSAQAQREADRHFQTGVALYKEAKYDAALAAFLRAHEIAPHPLVLYNIAECHRELLHYADAVAAYRQVLAEGKDRVAPARLATAERELTALLALVARLSVTVAPAGAGASLIVDGVALDAPVMPLILAPGEHRLIARAPGKRDAERTVRLAAGATAAIELVLGEPTPIIIERAAPPATAPQLALAVDAGFGMNLRRLGDTGAPSVGVSAAIGSRLGVGVDVVLVAYAVIPAVRVRLAGDTLSLHVVGAVPITFDDAPMQGALITTAAGLALRARATPRLAFRLESYVSWPRAQRDAALPTFLGGELWF